MNASGAGQAPVSHRLRVAEVIPETADAVSLVFGLTERQRERFRYRPGQFLTLRVPTEHGALARCYSLASSPHTDDRLTVTVKRIADGRASTWICDHVGPGTELDALEPAGVFTPASLDDDVLLLAAGSGITPILSIAKSTLAAGTGNVVLCYANRDEDAVIFRDELRRLEADYPERLTVLHWLESLQGIPTEHGLRGLLTGRRFTDVFLCGPKPFMTVARVVLRELGVERSRIHLERFSSLGGDPFADAVPADAPEPAGVTATSPLASTATEDAVALHVDIGDEPRRIDWPTGTRLLDLLVAHGVDVPSSCGEGVCASCECRVVEGEVSMVDNQILDADDIAEGYVLACQAVPVTRQVRISLD
ncbi:ferredoxin--NADP reductase [Haloechinothrix halophila]|uniref:ferredoxin--NADP reductase n=1 Tax=Haloechinothrix halophila TaxID=1069073 RepID=UPI00068723B2|nr:ferredoxin--NADP reductase [Haloechinothrix halophila]